MNLRGILAGCLTAASLVLFSGATASALTLELATAGSTLEFNDTDNDGVVVFGGLLSDFSVNGTIGLSQPVLGGPNLAMLDLSSVHIGGFGNLQITLSDFGYDLPWASQSALFGIDGLSTGTVTASAFANGTQIGDTLVLGPGGFSDTTSALLSLGSDPFGLSIQILIAHGVHGLTTFDASAAVASVPLPAALPLFLGALAMLGFLGRRRKETGPAVA